MVMKKARVVRWKTKILENQAQENLKPEAPKDARTEIPLSISAYIHCVHICKHTPTKGSVRVFLYIHAYSHCCKLEPLNIFESFRASQNWLETP